MKHDLAGTKKPKKPFLTERELDRIEGRIVGLQLRYSAESTATLNHVLNVDAPRLLDELRETLRMLDQVLLGEGQTLDEARPRFGGRR